MTKPSSETEALYKLVHDDVLNLIVTRQMFAGLYGADGDVDLLNRIASQTFAFIQRLFYDSLLLQTAKLYDTDAATASLMKLIILVRHDDAELGGRLRALLPANPVREHVRLHRNKRVAHTDHDVRSGMATLPTLVMADITTCTAAAHSIINAYSHAVHKTDIAKGVLMQTKGGTHVLLARLNEAEEFRRRHPYDWLTKRLVSNTDDQKPEGDES